MVGVANVGSANHFVRGPTGAETGAHLAMSTSTSAVAGPAPAVAATPGNAVASRRWWALAAAALGQLMIIADVTIMNLALPSAQRDLGMSDPTRQWVITTFALGYGGFLLLGGRVGELLGRRLALLTGMVGFAAASVLAGAAVNTGMLLAGRGLQGLFGALFSPAALALLGTTFTLPAERARAFAIFGTVMGSSWSIGLILGGLITDVANWRVALFVAVPLAAIAIAVTMASVPAGRTPAPVAGGTPRERLDIAGALLVTLGVMGLVFGFSRAETHGWGAGATIASLVAGVVLVAAFVAVEARTARPLLPLRIVLHRSRGGAYLAVFAIGSGLFTGLFLLTYYLQTVLGYAPAHAGAAFLPLGVTLIVGVRIVGRLIQRVPIRALLVVGLTSVAAGLAMIGFLRADRSYWTGALPALFLIGFGVGWVMMPANSIATLGAGRDAGVAGGAFMTSQQIGASLGLALFGSIAGAATASYVDSHTAATAHEALVHGFNVAAPIAAGFLLLAAVAVHLVIGPRGATATGGAPAVPAQPTPTPASAGERSCAPLLS